MVCELAARTIYNWREYETVVCTVCDSSNIAKILYGKPNWNDEMKEKIDSGELTLGGCFMSKDNPVYACNDCHARFGELYRDSLIDRRFFDHIDKLKREPPPPLFQ